MVRQDKIAGRGPAKQGGVPLLLALPLEGVVWTWPKKALLHN